MPPKADRLLRIGVVGCGPIAQFAHFEACQKGRNVTLHSICDVAEALRSRMALIWEPQKVFDDYARMLEDPELEAVIIATADAFHVPLALQAVQAGKHVLVEKPLSHSLEECRQLMEAADRQGVIVQVGHMKRFDPGISYARDFIQDKLGELIALKAWYCDHTHRYTETDNIQPLPFRSTDARKPKTDAKADLERYYMMAHGSHLLDTAYFLAGKIGSVRARLRRLADAWCWFVDVEFENGTLGHLDLTIKLRADWHEGFHVYGLGGSVFAKTYNPWYYRSSEVECFLEADQTFHRPLGPDGFSYRRQLEHFAAVILEGETLTGTSLREGLEVVKGMIAIKQSVDEGRTVYLDDLKYTSL